MNGTELEVQGYCDPRFAGVRSAFEVNFAEGREQGASFAATINGELVIDIWAGHSDAAGSVPWERDTIVNIFSTTKAMTSICMNILADRGVLKMDRRVAEYWPEFAQAGKADITVAEVLSHQAGLPDISHPITVTDLYDWDLIVGLLEKEAPWYEPGSRAVYHPLSWGYLAGEILRRVTGTSVSTFFREEVAEPLNADVHIGFGPVLDQRVGEIVPPPGPPPVPGTQADPMQRRLQMGPLLRADLTVCNGRAWRAAEIPAANGHGNARACARIMAALACGGALGRVRIMSEAALERAIVRLGGVNAGGVRRSWGLGFQVSEQADRIPAPAGSRAFGHGGAGGSFAVADLGRKLSWAYVMNQMDMAEAADPRAERLATALYACL